MFPINQDQGESSLAAVEKIENKIKVGKSFLFDFNKGDFVLIDGKVPVIEGKQALNVWIQKVLRTEKLKYKIYDIIDNSYGVSLIDYLNSDLPIGFIYASIQNEINGALTNHHDITSVGGFDFARSTKGLNVSFTVMTTYGQISEGVSV